MKKQMLVLALFLVATTGFGQSQLPTDGLRHHFTFDDPSNLEEASVGNTLVRDTLSGVTPVYNSVNGPTVDNKAVEVGQGSFYRLDLDFDANGPDTATRVNQFTLVIDFYLPVTGVWYAFHDANNEGDPTAGDWDSFIRSNGPLGVGSTGYSRYAVPEQEWHRLIISADLGNSYRYYLDGQLAQYDDTEPVDGRFSLPSIDGSNQILLFGDNDGEDANIYIAELGVYDRSMDDYEAYSLGGYGHYIPQEKPFGQWLFDNENNLSEAFYGYELEIVGSTASVAGPEEADKAISISEGAYLKSVTNMVATNGGDRANVYTFVTDVRIDALGEVYSLMATDTLPGDAVLKINANGQIGSDDLGYTDTAIVAGDWYRIAMTVDLGGAGVKLYLDGDSVYFGGVQEVDNRYSLQTFESGNKVVFFGDDNGDDAVIDVASLVLYNRTLSSEDVKKLGGYDHSAPNTEVTGASGAVHFNGTAVTNKYGVIQKTNEDFNFGSGDFTIEMWVKPDLGYPSDPALLSDKDWGSGGNAGWVISIRGDDWKFNAADQNRNRYDLNGPDIHDGNWHHIAVIANQDSGLKLLTDDLETVWYADAAFFNCDNIDNTSMPLVVAQDGTTRYSDGPPAPAQIDEIRIWKGVAVDPSVVKSWRNKEVTESHPNYANLVGYWQFNEGTGSTVADQSGKNNHMTLVGNPKWDVSYAAVGNETAQTGQDLNAIWGGQYSATSGGLSLAATFPLTRLFKTAAVENVQADPELPYLVFGHNGGDNASTTGVSGDVKGRLNRVWYFDQTETAVSDLSLTFDFSDLGGNSTAGSAAGYVLLNASEVNGAYTPVDGSVAVVDDSVIVSGVVVLDGYYTLGSTDLVNSALGGLVVGVNDNQNQPVEFHLSQNYPNPFNPSTTINYTLPVAASVEMTIYNMLGQVVDVLVKSNVDAGAHSVKWNAAKFTSGLYFYSIKAVGSNGKVFEQTQKMMLVK